MANDTIHLQSRFKSVKIVVDGGKMDYATSKSRTPRVERPPAVIMFEGGVGKVEKESRRTVAGATWQHADWSDLGATSRSGAVAKIQALNGYGVDFTITDVVVDAGKREPAAVG